MLAPTTTTLMRALLLLALAARARSDSDAAAADGNDNGEGYRDPFEDVLEATTRVQPHKPPESLLDFAEYLAPVLKYYVVLLGFFAIARYFNRMLEAEDSLKEKEELQKRPNLRQDPMEDSDDSDDDDDDASSDEKPEDALKHRKAAAAAVKAKTSADGTNDLDDDIHEELITNGSKLVAMSTSELKARRKSKKNHPLFEGLQKIEEELKQKKQQGDGDGDGAASDVSWNELHASMLKRYQQKYPEHGLRVQTNDDYDDEFKELLKKHAIDPEAIRQEIAKDKAA